MRLISGWKNPCPFIRPFIGGPITPFITIVGAHLVRWCPAWNARSMLQNIVIFARRYIFQTIMFGIYVKFRWNHIGPPTRSWAVSEETNQKHKKQDETKSRGLCTHEWELKWSHIPKNMAYNQDTCKEMTRFWLNLPECATKQQNCLSKFADPQHKETKKTNKISSIHFQTGQVSCQAEIRATKNPANQQPFSDLWSFQRKIRPH